jgi:hypothetical protein
MAAHVGGHARSIKCIEACLMPGPFRAEEFPLDAETAEKGSQTRKKKDRREAVFR